MLRVSLTYIYYAVDPVGFIEELCENKDAPELHCDGKCQLMKVAQSSQSSEKVPINLIDFKEILLYKEVSLVYYFKSISTIGKSIFIYSNNYSFLKMESCFHPPQNSFYFLG